MLRVALGLTVALWASSALADDKVAIGPAPDWVKPVLAAKPAADEEAGRPVRTLRYDQQLRFEADRLSVYEEQVNEIRTPLGLQAMGAFSLTWDPGHERVTVHRLRVLRGGQVVDVLAKQSFQVTQVEAELDTQVEGRLVASLHPEDLRVGDVVEFAFTVTRADPVMQGHADTVVSLASQAELQSFRATWPSDLPVSFLAGRGLQTPKAVRKGAVTELLIERKAVEPTPFPRGAPPRYWARQELEFTTFRSWADISTMMVPLYDAAATLAPDSPLRPEIEKIRAASSDSKARAGAALKLVEDNVRYLALLLSDGGYTPVAADKTWQRRFGDCKAKTALLVAILRELGIKAEAAVVNAYGSPDLDKRLPRMTAFNHVIVRVEIDGRVYWLDGTRQGDESLDALDIPPHDFALPLRREGAQLIALTRVPRALPDNEIALTIDAHEGVESAAPVHGEIVMRGDAALWPALMTSTLKTADREKMLKAMWARYPWIEVKTVSAARDPKTGDSRMTMDGIAKMVWFPSYNGLVFPVPEATVGRRTQFKRDAGQDPDAPFLVPGYPGHGRYRLSIKLPYDGAGFSTEGGRDVDRTLAGIAYRRTSAIKDGVLSIEVESKVLAPEITASEARAAADELTRLSAERIVIQSPRGYRPTAGDIAALVAREPKTVPELLARGGRLFGVGRRDEALADFERAVAVDPTSAAAYAARGLAYIEIGRDVPGKADLDKASSLGTRNAQVQAGLGILAMKARRYEEAVTAFSRAADMQPNNGYAIRMRANARLALGQRDKALADLDEVIEMDPRAFDIHGEKAQIYIRAGDLTSALKSLDAAIALAPREPWLLNLRGEALSGLGRREEALKSLSESIAIRPTREAYVVRALRARSPDDLAGKLADMDAIEKLEPGMVRTARMRAEILLDADKSREAVAFVSGALKTHPADTALLITRATAHAKTGNTAAALKDFGSARLLSKDNAQGLNELCWMQATIGVALEAALADCDAALKLRPNTGAYVDSRAFVLLRLGRLKESVEAYDEAVRLAPKQAASLYGRGLAKLRLGQAQEGQADLAAARSEAREVDQEFARYGLRP